MHAIVHIFHLLFIVAVAEVVWLKSFPAFRPWRELGYLPLRSIGVLIPRSVAVRRWQTRLGSPRPARGVGCLAGGPSDSCRSRHLQAKLAVIHRQEPYTRRADNSPLINRYLLRWMFIYCNSTYKDSFYEEAAYSETGAIPPIILMTTFREILITGIHQSTINRKNIWATEAMLRRGFNRIRLSTQLQANRTKTTLYVRFVFIITDSS